MKYIFVFRGHVLTESTGCVLILTFTIRRVPAPFNGCGPHAGKSGKEALTHESGIFCRHRKNGK